MECRSYWVWTALKMVNYFNGSYWQAIVLQWHNNRTTAIEYIDKLKLEQ